MLLLGHVGQHVDDGSNDSVEGGGLDVAPGVGHEGDEELEGLLEVFVLVHEEHVHTIHERVDDLGSRLAATFYSWYFSAWVWKSSSNSRV